MTAKNWWKKLEKDKQTVNPKDRTEMLCAIYVYGLWQFGKNLEKIKRWICDTIKCDKSDLNNIHQFHRNMISGGGFIGNKIVGSSKKEEWYFDYILQICIAQGYIKRSRRKSPGSGATSKE